MEAFNPHNVDFCTLDIDKYLDWLLERYNNFTTIWILPHLNSRINKEYFKLYKIHGRKIARPNYICPPVVENRIKKRIEFLENEKAKYSGLVLELIYFEGIEYDKTDLSPKQYGFFSRAELENIKIRTTDLRRWLTKDKESYYNELIDEITARKARNPLPEKAFYKQELNALLSNFDFEYLPQIINGQFIYNLNDFTNALHFATEIDKIRIAIYLDCKIKNESPNHPPTKPLQWTGQINSLVTIFAELLNAELIKNDFGTKENIKRLLIGNFVDNENKPLSKNSIDEVLKTSKMKTDKKMAIALAPFIEYLSNFKENSP